MKWQFGYTILHRRTFPERLPYLLIGTEENGCYGGQGCNTHMITVFQSDKYFSI